MLHSFALPFVILASAGSNPPPAIGLLHSQWPDPGLHTATDLHPIHMITAAQHLALPEMKEVVRPGLTRNLPAPLAKEPMDGLGPLNVHGGANSFIGLGTSADPSIAVGDQYMLVINDHWIAFYDRAGNPLPSKGGNSTSMSATDFFKTFWAPKLTSGQPNPNNINLHTGFPGGAIHVDPYGDPSQKGMINEWYDSRCFFDSYSHKFYFLSAARNQLWVDDPKGNPLGIYSPFVRRYYAFAISHDEDPRDGFDMWMTTSSNDADWPRLTVTYTSMIVAHNGPENGKPFAYVFSKADLLANNPNPSSFEYYGNDFPNSAKVLPVHVYGPSAFCYFVGFDEGWNPIRIYGFKNPSSFHTKAPLVEDTEHFSDNINYRTDEPKWRNGFLYLCFDENYVSNRTHVRYLRIPCKDAGGSIKTSRSASDGFLDHYFGLNGPGDAPTDQVSYMRPALAVNKNGDCAIVYGRVGVKTSKPPYPEARYSLLYHNQSSQNPSTLLHAGDFNPGTGMEKRLDLVNAAVDPVDDTTLWIVHAFADHTINDYRMVIAHVKP